MDKKEFGRIAMAIKTYYPKENIIPNEQALELWFFQLQDIPYKVCELALNKWVSLNKWSPSIADIREYCAEIKLGFLPDWSECWEEAQKKISYYGRYRPDEAMQQMSEMTRKIVQRLGYSRLCDSENTEADRANFRMIYNIEAKRERDNATIPATLKNLISATSEQLTLEDGKNAITLEDGK